MSVGTAILCSSREIACWPIYHDFQVTPTIQVLLANLLNIYMIHYVDRFMYKRKTYFAWRERSRGGSISPVIPRSRRGSLGFFMLNL